MNISSQMQKSINRSKQRAKLLTKYSFSDQFPSLIIKDPEDDQFNWKYYMKGINDIICIVSKNLAKEIR